MDINQNNNEKLVDYRKKKLNVAFIYGLFGNLKKIKFFQLQDKLSFFLSGLL